MKLPTKKSLVVSLPSTPIKGDSQPETNETVVSPPTPPDDAELIGAGVVGGAFETYISTSNRRLQMMQSL